jgi:hypothetical protein
VLLMRRLSLFLTLLMVLAPFAGMVAPLVDEVEVQDSITQTDGWGEDDPWRSYDDQGITWNGLAQRGADDWVRSSVADFADSVEDLDVAISPDQTVKACGYNATSGDLEMFTLSTDGVTTRATVDSVGDVGRGCSIVVDYRGFARIAYLDVDASSLKVVRENDFTPFPDDDWLVRTLVNDVNITTAPRISIYSNGTMAIAYRDADTGGLHLMRFTGSYWRHTEMMAAGTAEDIVLNIDVNDVLHLAFLDSVNERVAVISLDGDERTFSVVDEGEGIGQPLGHHLDATTRAQLVYGIENGTGLRIVRDLAGRDDGRIAPEPFFLLDSNQTGFGTGADATGDFNGDGYSDLVYSVPSAANDTGEVHIHHGSVDGYSSAPDISIPGAHPGALFGAALAVVGDANGDGYDDLLVGAPDENNASGNATGMVHLFTGFPTGISTSPFWSVSGSGDGAQFGARVAAAGDVDGDGFRDLLVSELGWTATNGGKGRVHLFSGNSTLETTSVTVEGTETDLILGWSILGPGDANGDGFDDVVIGSSDDAIFVVSGRGRAQVHHGGAGGISATADRLWSMSSTWTLFGNTLSALGDVNADGFDDLAVSEMGNGTLWIFYGSTGGYPANPTAQLSGNDNFGHSIINAGDINDDGVLDIMVGTPGSGSSGGQVGVYTGTNASDLYDGAAAFFNVNGDSNQHLGRILSAGGDADRDGTHEFLYASTTAASDGSDGGSIVLVETRDWELSDLPFDFTVDGLDLAVDAQGRTQLLLDTDSGVYHYERANEHLTSADPWGSTVLGDLATAAMAVTPAGQPTVVSSAGAGLDFDRRHGGIIIQMEPITASGSTVGTFGSIASGTPGLSMAAFRVGYTITFVNQTGNGVDTDIVQTGVTMAQPTQLLIGANATPNILWRDDVTQIIHLAVQNGTEWDFSNLAGGTDGSQFGAVMADNGSIGLLVRNATAGLVTEWHEGAGDNWTRTAQVIISANFTEATGQASLRRSSGGLEVVWQDNATVWHHQTIEDGNITDSPLPAMNATRDPAHLYAGGLLLPGALVNTTGTHVIVDAAGSRTIDLGCADAAKVEILDGPNGLTRVLCTDSSATLLVNLLEGEQVIRFSGANLAGVNMNDAPVATIDANGTWHILYHSLLNKPVIAHRIADADRDFVPDLFDDLPDFGGQWTDGDGDGYGENPDAPNVDRCPNLAGSSAYGYHGCADVDGDGFANAVDDCSDSGKSWKDRLGCDDSDGDGWSDPSGDAGWNGDRHPTNWMQAIDTDGDGRYDNHGPDCCGQNTNSDEFPLDPQQWEDLDGDGWGDNSSAPTGDKCPGLMGTSIHDRGGCTDSDGDGWSDPVEPSTQNPEGWTYNRTRCYTVGQHCADLYPWAPEDVSAENVCAARCDEQWADRDGDGYGDNSSIDAWNRDAFPMDYTQWVDSDEDGWGDNQSGNNPDDCWTQWGNSTVDRRGCEDFDGDGHSNVYTFETNQTTGLREQELGDALPNDPNQWRDRDGDGFGENGIGDDWDRCPTIPGALAGVPGPGCPLPAGDADGDSVPDQDDQCPDTPQNELADIFGCSESQRDADSDGVMDSEDMCPDTEFGASVNAFGCSPAQTNIDSDGDGVNDMDDAGEMLDLCPWTTPGELVDENGCAASQRDTDLDGVSDDIDLCEDTTFGAAVDAFGCVIAGADTDEDGVEDADDKFPADATQWADTDEDGFGDNWADPSWDVEREGTVGERIANATEPDACPQAVGNSTTDRYGCRDSDGDGYSNPDTNWVAHPNGTADAFENNATQWHDSDGDGFGDNNPGYRADECPNNRGIFGGEGGDGCPAAATLPWAQQDDDTDRVLNGVDKCQGTPDDEWSKVDDDGCSPSQLESEEATGPLDGGPMLYVAIAMGAIIGIAIILLIIGRLRRGGIEWDEDDLLDDGDDYDDDDDDWSPFDAGSIPSAKPASSMPGRGPPGDGGGFSVGGPPASTLAQRPGATPGAGRGPPSPTPGARPAGRPGGVSRPGGTPFGGGEAKSQPAPAKKTRRTAPNAEPESDRSVRKTRRTAKPAEDEAPVRKTRRTRKTEQAPAKKSRRRKGGAGFDDLFSADEKGSFDTSVEAEKQRLIIGDSDSTVLARLQADGWNVKQSKMILGHAKR